MTTTVFFLPRIPPDKLRPPTKQTVEEDSMKNMGKAVWIKEVLGNPKIKKKNQINLTL